MPFFHCNQTSVVLFFEIWKNHQFQEPGKSLILQKPMGKWAYIYPVNNRRLSFASFQEPPNTHQNPKFEKILYFNPWIPNVSLFCTSRCKALLRYNVKCETLKSSPTYWLTLPAAQLATILVPQTSLRSKALMIKQIAGSWQSLGAFPCCSYYDTKYLSWRKQLQKMKWVLHDWQKLSCLAFWRTM
jgi:hypothetical protein